MLEQLRSVPEILRAEQVEAAVEALGRILAEESDGF